MSYQLIELTRNAAATATPEGHSFMAAFFRNTDTAVPVLFYFDKAAKLERYEFFTVEEMPQARPHQTPANVVIWAVCAQARESDRREVIAEFPNQLYAEIFRDMAELVAAH